MYISNIDQKENDFDKARDYWYNKINCEQRWDIMQKTNCARYKKISKQFETCLKYVMENLI